MRCVEDAEKRGICYERGILRVLRWGQEDGIGNSDTEMTVDIERKLK